MDIKGILASKEKPSGEYYWSVVIETGWVQAGIWQADEEKARVVAVGSPFPWQKVEDLVEAVDSSLSVAIQNLEVEDIEPEKVVFGLPADWVEDSQRIKSEYQNWIKKICDELSLKPVGFVVLTEALAYCRKSEEGGPVDAIIVGVGEETLNLSLFLKGEFKGEFSVLRSVSLAEDVVEGLSRFSLTEPFPPRVILYNGRESELEEVRQQLIDIHWEEYPRIHFLHPPKVEIIKPEEKVLATSLAGGSELTGAKTVERVWPESILREEEPETREKKNENLTPVSERMDFVVGEDIRKASEEIIGRIEEEKIQEENKEVSLPSLPAEKAEPSIQTLPSAKKAGFLKRILAQGERVKSGFHFKQPFSFGIVKKPFLIGGLVFIGLFAAAFSAWWFLSSAKVTIYVTPRSISKNVNLNLETTASSVDVSQLILPAKKVEKEVSGEKTSSVKGTKILGEKAKGKVTIYRTGDETSLDKGTKIQSAAGLVFSLDDDVDIASGSASNPGKTEASVTALDIGAEYNLAAGESFTVGNYATSSMEAKNEVAFTGGSSREVNAVSEEDYETILSDLKNELSQKALDELGSNLNQDEMIIKESVEEEVKEQNYDHKVGDEADSLKLNLALKVTALVIKKSDLFDLANEVLKNEVPSGYVLRPDQLETHLKPAEVNKEKVTLEANFVANLLPSVNNEEITKAIAGRSPDQAKDFLIKVKGYDKVQISIKPSLPFTRLTVLTHRPQKITLEVQAVR